MMTTVELGCHFTILRTDLVSCQTFIWNSKILPVKWTISGQLLQFCYKNCLHWIGSVFDHRYYHGYCLTVVAHCTLVNQIHIVIQVKSWFMLLYDEYKYCSIVYLAYVVPGLDQVEEAWYKNRAPGNQNWIHRPDRCVTSNKTDIIHNCYVHVFVAYIVLWQQ